MTSGGNNFNYFPENPSNFVTFCPPFPPPPKISVTHFYVARGAFGCLQFMYPWRMEGWVDLVDLIAPPAGSRTSDLSITSPTPNCCTTNIVHLVPQFDALLNVTHDGGSLYMNIWKCTFVCLVLFLLVFLTLCVVQLSSDVCRYVNFSGYFLENFTP